jgi:hypothetical protein
MTFSVAVAILPLDATVIVTTPPALPVVVARPLELIVTTPDGLAK